MKHFNTIINTALTMLVLSGINGCDTSTPVAGNDTKVSPLSFADIHAPNEFAFSVYNETGLTVRLSIDSEEGVVPYYGATIHFIEGGSDRLLASYITDNNGEVLYDGANVSSSVEAIGVSVYAAGIPEDTLWYSKEQLSTLDRIVILNPTTYNESDANASIAAKKATVSEIVKTPGILYSTEKHPGKDFALVSGALFVERNDINPAPTGWKKTKQIYINALTDPSIKNEIWAHFMHTGAGYQNAFGYYWYKRSENPTGALSGINRVTLFSMIDGFYSIQKQAPKALIGTVTDFKSRLADANDEIVIGFWLHADYEQGNKPNNPIWYSKNAYNVQLHGLKEKKHHVSFPSLSDPTEFVFGIEDLRNGESDEDYNDLILIIDDIDESTVCDYLNDPSCFNCSELPYNKSSRLAFEDQYPQYGDFDYNDVVVDIDYTVVAQQCNVLGVPIYDASYGIRYAPQLLNGSVAVTPVANGALYPLGFAVALKSDYANAVVTVENSSSRVVRINDEPIIEFFDFMRDEFTPQPSTIFVNTDPIAGNSNAPAYTPKSTLRANILFNQGTAIPEKKLSLFNPFIFFTDNVQREIHMRNGVLSARGIAQNIVGSPAEGHPYEDDNGIPWAIEINQATRYPVEFQDFLGAYPNYSKWALDGTHKGWANKGVPAVLY